MSGAPPPPLGAPTGPAEPSGFEAIQQLLHHWDRLSPDRRVSFAQMAVVVCQFMAAAADGAGGGAASPATAGPVAPPQPSTPSAVAAASTAAAAPTSPSTSFPLPGAINTKAVALLLARFACNNHTICDDELRPIGVGIYPLAALANHSCRPSCAQSFEGPTIVFRAVSDLSPGDEVTISYVELAATRHERRAQLAASYFFDIDDEDEDEEVAAAEGAEGAAQQKLPSSASAAAAAAAVPSQSPPPAAAAGAAVDGDSMQSSADGVSTLPPPAERQGRKAKEALAVAALRPLRPPPLLQHKLDEHTVLLVYGSATDRINQAGQPPWRCDAADAQLCQLVLAEQAAARLRVVPLAGGLEVAEAAPSGTEDSSEWLSDIVDVASMGLEDEGDEEEGGGLDYDVSRLEGSSDAGGKAAAADVELQGGQSRSEQRRLERALHAAAAGASSLATGGKAGASPAAAAAAAAPAKLEVHVWGPWVAALLADYQAGVTTAGPLSRQELAAGAEGGQACVPATAVTSQQVTDVATCVADCWRAHMQGEQQSLSGAQTATQRVAALRQALQQAEPVRDGRPGLAATHALRMRLNAALLKALIDEGSDWQAALHVARDLLPVYEVVYPKVWPNRALHHAALAKLEAFAGSMDSAVGHAAKALAALSLLLRRDSAVITAMTDVMGQAHMERMAARLPAMAD